jgi:hypothetical protein
VHKKKLKKGLVKAKKCKKDRQRKTTTLWSERKKEEEMKKGENVRIMCEKKKWSNGRFVVWLNQCFCLSCEV